MKICATNLVAALGLAVAAFVPAANASAYSDIVVYGDSLSDNGNLYKYTGIPGAPYYEGRFSNGPVAVEQLANLLGVPLIDYAFGGATTGYGNVGGLGLPGMLAELAGSSVPSALIPTSLFVVWGGADDFESGGSAQTAVANIDKIVATLQSEGATHILVPDLPNLGLTPEFSGSAVATLYSQTFDQLLQASLPSDVTFVDLFSDLGTIQADPGAYGFTNATGSCYQGNYLTTGTACSDPNDYLFFDDIHPTSAADAIVADQFLAAVTTPEPSSLLLLGTGLAGVAGLVRRRFKP